MLLFPLSYSLDIFGTFIEGLLSAIICLSSEDTKMSNARRVTRFSKNRKTKIGPVFYLATLKTWLSPNIKYKTHNKTKQNIKTSDISRFLNSEILKIFEKYLIVHCTVFI